jgi:hypothetical protein
MIAHEIPAETGDDVVRFVRALGQHRYVASRLHLVHVFAIEAASIGRDPRLEQARAWAIAVLADAEIDRGSRDERLMRRVTDEELGAVVEAFWSSTKVRPVAQAVLAGRLREIGVSLEPATPFDETREGDMFPVLVDAGWELLPLAALDPVRHKGAINAFENALAFDVAKFEQDNAVPEQVTLFELPALGPTELLACLEENESLRAPFVLWTLGHDVYTGYVLSGVRRAAKLSDD